MSSDGSAQGRNQNDTMPGDLLIGLVMVLIGEMAFLTLIYSGDWSVTAFDRLLAMACTAFAIFFFISQICRKLLKAAQKDFGIPVIDFVRTIMISAMLTILGFALIYHVFGLSHDAAPGQEGARMIYFSAVTFSTLGFGDITPSTTLSQQLAALEAMLGNLHLAALVGAILAAVKLT